MTVIVFDDRPAEHDVAERIWRSRSDDRGTFHSMATPNWNVVVSRVQGQTTITVRGPETRATMAECPVDGNWVGVHFALGTFMPGLMPAEVKDRHDITLPAASGRAFWLNGSAWEYPTFDNVDVFVARLVRKGIVQEDSRVRDLLRGVGNDARSLRTTQRRILRATGAPLAAMRQIARARRATLRLRDGLGISDTALALGYYDQAHLTRALRRFIGLTPARIARGGDQLSLLYKTADDRDGYGDLEPGFEETDGTHPDWTRSGLPVDGRRDETGGGWAGARGAARAGVSR